VICQPGDEEKEVVMTMTGPSDTAGVDIGNIANVGGSIPGMNALMKTASRTPEFAELGNQWRAAKDFNDQAVPWLAGASGGSAVYGPASWEDLAL
jgi:hypothetical protein